MTVQEIIGEVRRILSIPEDVMIERINEIIEKLKDK